MDRETAQKASVIPPIPPVSATPPQAEISSVDHLTVPPVMDQPSGDLNNPGSSVASLWLQVRQDKRPPVSIPSTALLQHCPQCKHQLASKLQWSEFRKCPVCGWTSQPQSSSPIQPTVEPADTDLQRLLNQATAEAIDNMKPRKRSKRED